MLRVQSMWVVVSKLRKVRRFDLAVDVLDVSFQVLFARAPWRGARAMALFRLWSFDLRSSQFRSGRPARDQAASLLLDFGALGPWRFDGRDGRHSPWFEPTHNNSIESIRNQTRTDR